MLSEQVKPQAFRIYSEDYDVEEVFDMPQQLVTISGIGMPSVKNMTVQSPFQDGETHVGFTLRPRLLQIGFHLAKLWGGASWTEHRTRQRMLSILNPAIGTFCFEVVMNNGDVYHLEEVFYEAGFSAGLPANTGDSNKQDIAVRLRCGWPLWLGEEHTLEESLATSSATFACETYGNYFSWPVITLTGPLTKPYVYLLRWDLDTADYATVAVIGVNAAIGAGDSVYITTRPTQRSVLDEAGNYVDLTSDTVFNFFRLTPHPIRALHDLQTDANWYNNFIRVTASAYGAGASVKVVHSDHWIGL